MALLPRVGTATIGGLTGLVLGGVILGPALAPGYTLHYDLVHVPDLALSARTLGTDGAVPRAVPNDLVVALLSTVLPGWVVQKLLLLGALVVGAVGAARLARTRWGALAAAVLWTWNPWVGERLGIGHWGYLVGYALLPWVLAAAARLRSGERARLATAGAVAVAALGGSTAGVLATLLAVAVLLVPGGPPVPWRRRAADLGVVLLVAVTADAAWWWPFLTAASRAADPTGAAAFAAAADTPFGVVGSVLLGGGIWNDQMWFDERATPVVAGVALVAVLAVVGLALRRASWWAEPLTKGATLAGVLGLVLAVLAALPGGTTLLTTVVTQVPGGGLLRDGQKLAALWVLLLAVALARVVDELAAARRGRAVLAVLVLWPVATLPTLALGHMGEWGSVDYPTPVLETAQWLDGQVGPDETLAVMPWSTYRRYGWDDRRVVLDPWPRLLAGDVVTDDRLRLRDGDVAGEDPRAAAISRAVDEGEEVPAALEAAGVRWVLVETDQPDPEGSVQGLPDPVLVDEGIAVHDLGSGITRDGTPEGPGRYVGLALTGATLLALAVLALPAALRARADRTPPGRHAARTPGARHAARTLGARHAARSHPFATP